jgi:hypothetical protein
MSSWLGNRGKRDNVDFDALEAKRAVSNGSNPANIGYEAQSLVGKAVSCDQFPDEEEKGSRTRESRAAQEKGDVSGGRDFTGLKLMTDPRELWPC